MTESKDRVLPRIGQLVDCYLRTTENWCYRIFRNIPEATLQIVTTTVMNEEMFPLPRTEFVTAPLARLCGCDSGFQASLAKKVQLPLLLPWRISVASRTRTLHLLHAHFSVMGWNYLWLADRLSVPLVVSFYGFDYEWLPRTIPKWRDRYVELFRRGDLFLAEGDHGRAKLVEMGCPEEKVRVVHLGVEPAAIPFVRKTKGANRLRLVQVATFTEKKGYETTVKAFAKALRSSPEMELTLIGRDPERKRRPVEELIAELGVGERVKIVDGVDFASLHRTLGAFDVFIHPSCYSESGDCEGGAPVVLLDAQATGLPVISTTHCDIPDEVVHGVTGLLAPEGDADAVAAHIDYFYRMDDEEYQRFSANARRHVEAEYDVTKSGILLRQLYQEVLDKKGRGLP